MAGGQLIEERNQAFYSVWFLSWARALANLATAFVLVGGVVQVLAADLPASGNASQMSLKSSTKADIVRNLSVLRKKTEQNGTMWIIVGLRIAFTAVEGLTATAVAQQRNEIADLQALVLEKVPSLNKRPESIKRFAFTPFMALEVNAAELEALAGLAEITSIEEDRVLAPASGFEAVTPESK